jgi:3-oxoacyl-[acyl-carrier-protein] synthase II
MKDVYVIEYVVKDCIGDSISENYLNLPQTKGATTAFRYNPADYEHVLCTKGFQMDYVDKDYSCYNMLLDLIDLITKKYPVELLDKDTAIIFGSFAPGTIIKEEFYSAFESKLRRFSPTKLFRGNHDLMSAFISGKLKLEGINTSLNAACSSSMFNLHYASMLIQTGQCNMAFVGNVDMTIYPTLQYYWQCTSAISTINGGTCKPFDRSRDGFLQGEGGTIWLICDEETLVKKNLTPKARICSIVSGAKVTSMTAHDKSCENQLSLIDKAYKMSGLNSKDMAFFNAHATSTFIGDDIEVDVFQRAFENCDSPLVGFKGYIGHTMSACGLIESAYGLEAIKNKKLWGNYNLDDPLTDDPRLIVKPVTLNSNKFIKASFGFGGRTNIAIFENLQ